ncbi:MAG: hypothetical protein EHM15_12910 [Desulfobacteraceae bacterium]|nr:MAG: hypothetical protein EHM15_12910 [Desulfobacteraceae bacterium]
MLCQGSNTVSMKWARPLISRVMIESALNCSRHSERSTSKRVNRSRSSRLRTVSRPAGAG